MNNSRLVKISKYLSKHLRHQPERIGLKLAPGGWVAVDELLAACSKHLFPITRADLNQVVASNDKKRFSFDSTGALIRANQGHSVEVDLQLEATVPQMCYTTVQVTVQSSLFRTQVLAKCHGTTSIYRKI